jgi:hypothetical protein
MTKVNLFSSKNWLLEIIDQRLSGQGLVPETFPAETLNFSPSYWVFLVPHLITVPACTCFQVELEAKFTLMFDWPIAGLAIITSTFLCIILCPEFHHVDNLLMEITLFFLIIKCINANKNIQTENDY